MGVSTDAILYYGFAPNWGDDGDPPPWEVAGFDDFDDWVAHAARIEEPTYPIPPGTAGNYFAQVEAAVAATGLEVVLHCSDDCTQHGLALRSTVVRAARGYPEEINMAAMTALPDASSTFEKFAALMGLDLDTLGTCSWWLVSYWG